MGGGAVSRDPGDLVWAPHTSVQPNSLSYPRIPLEPNSFRTSENAQRQGDHPDSNAYDWPQTLSYRVR